MIYLQIVDQNQPEFEQLKYSAKIAENAQLETPILQIQAKSSTNGELVYQIVDGDLLKQFEIGFRDGKLLLNDVLDRERQAKYELKVQVLDLSRQNVSATTMVEIEIEDVNDSAPEFQQDIYKFSISESTPIGTLIGKVNATDPDLTPKDNQITYQLVNGNKSILSIDQFNGQIYLSSLLDFEREQFLEWSVVARDTDGLSGQAIIQLEVLDENDSPVKFSDKSPLKLKVQATDKFDGPRFLHQFKAIDLDTVSSLKKGNYHYSIESGDESFFKLDSQNGILTQIRSFDKQELAKFFDGNDLQKELNISVSDGLFIDHLQATIMFKPSPNQIEPLQFSSLINEVSLNENR